MEEIIGSIKSNSDKYYDIMNSYFTKKLLDIDNEVNSDDTEQSRLYSRVLYSTYNVMTQKDSDILNSSYFLRFTPYFMNTEYANDYYDRLQYLVSIATLGLQNQRINEIKLTLGSEDLKRPNYEEMNWAEILYLEGLRLYLLLIRKKEGWKDIEEIKATIDNLLEMQLEHEKAMAKAYELSQMEIAQLIILYNTIAAIKEATSYLENGLPSTIDVKLSRFNDNIQSCFETGIDSKFKFSIENIMNGVKIIVNNSVWKRLKTGTSKDKFIQIMVEKSNSKPIFELLPSQIEAFNAGIADPLKSAVVIQMHTSAGKSLLAHYLIMQAIEDNKNSKIAYVVPTRALVHQVLYDLKNTFSSLNLNVVATIPAYEIDAVEEKVLDEKIDILVTTPEKLNLLIKSEHPSVEDLTLVVVDEAHNISDKNRGLSLEFMLATIRRQKEYLRIIMLTPFIKDDDNRELIAKWLGEERGLPVYSQWKPTRQIISVVSRVKEEGERLYKFKLRTLQTHNVSGFNAYPLLDEEIKFNGRKPSIYRELVTKIAAKYINYGNILVLVNSQKDAEEQAVHIANSITEESTDSTDLKILIKFAEEELGEAHPLIKCLHKKVAFHHGGLPEEVRILIESMISKGYIKYIIGTTTLAQGMNFPISTVVIKSLQFAVKQGQYWTYEDMTPETFWNIAGRAGRVFKDFVGRIVFVALEKEREDKVRDFVNKNVSGINSAIFETIKNIDEMSVKFNTRLVADNPQLSQLLQYVSHTLKYVNEKEGMDTEAQYILDEIIRLSLAYRQLKLVGEKNRKKLLSFVQKYLNQLKKQTNWSGVAGLVDKTGFSSVTVNFLMQHKNELPDFNELTLEILRSDIDKFAELIDIIGKVPEISLGVGGIGQFSPELVAKIAQAWVSGKSILDIHNTILKNHHDSLAQSVAYIYRIIATRLSWGIGAMQTISLAGSEEAGDIVNLPSMIFYGVPNDKGVLLRMAGIPRSLAVKMSATKYDLMKVDNLTKTKEWLENLPESDWNSFAPKSKLTGKEWKRVWEIIEGK